MMAYLKIFEPHGEYQANNKQNTKSMDKTDDLSTKIIKVRLGITNCVGDT